MNSIEYMGYEFTQGDYSDRYEILNTDGERVELGWEKPNMTIQDAMAVIQRYIAVRDAVRRMIA